MNQYDKYNALLFVIAGIITFGLPAIPGIIVWHILSPHGFYQKLITLVIGIILYFVTAAIAYENLAD